LHLQLAYFPIIFCSIFSLQSFIPLFCYSVSQ
jgi:hypothetical protein